MERTGPILLVPLIAVVLPALDEGDSAGFLHCVGLLSIYLLLWLYRRELTLAPAVGIYVCVCLLMTLPAGQRVSPVDSLQLILAVASLIGVAGIVYYTVAEIRQQARRERAAEGQCRECGYDLRGSGETCPECGPVRSEAVVSKLR
jgi:hypothetical protein